MLALDPISRFVGIQLPRLTEKASAAATLGLSALVVH